MIPQLARWADIFLASLLDISTKEKFETKKHELSSKLEAFDSKSLQTAENNLKREESNISDISSKLKVFEDENLDLTHSLPTILHEIETNLKDVTATSYTISLDDQWSLKQKNWNAVLFFLMKLVMELFHTVKLTILTKWS